MAVFLFYSGFILAVFALYREVVKQWFVNTPFFLYILACALTVCIILPFIKCIIGLVWKYQE